MRIFSVINECEGKDLEELEVRVNEKRTSGVDVLFKIFMEPD
jgi:hypothetical protein